MKGTLTILRPSGEITQQDYASEVPLKDLNDAVGGYLETIPYFNTFDGKFCIAFCNEHSKINRLPANEPATHLWYRQTNRMIPGDYLAGSIAILTGDGEFMSNL